MGNFIHSDLTNTRDLIEKLNLLEDSSASTGDNLLIECHNSEDRIIFNENYDSVFEDIRSAYELSKNIILKLEYNNSATTIFLRVSSYEETSGGPYTFKFSSIKQNNDTENIIYIITFTKSSNTSPVYSAILNEQSVSKVLFFDIDATDYVSSVDDLDGLEEYITTLPSSSYFTPILQASQSSTELPMLRIQTGYGVEQFSFLRRDIDTFDSEAVLFSNVRVIDNNEYYLNVVTIFDDTLWTLKSYFVNSTETRLNYNELVTKINNDELIPNHYYIITDYVTKTNLDSGNGSYKSAEHPFMLKVQAASNNRLYPEAHALPVEDDTYFQYCDLSKWKIWYDINNDTSKYAWVNSYSKGVIYRMIDEYGNDCPYDFKNIIFKRYKATVTLSGQTILDGYYYWSNSTTFMPSTLSIDNNDYTYMYTFSCEDNEGNFNDDTVLELLDTEQLYRLKNNIIKNNSNQLLNIILILPHGLIQHEVTETLKSNTFENNCENITCIAWCDTNIFNNCQNVICHHTQFIKGNILYNTIIASVDHSNIEQCDRTTIYDVSWLNLINSTVFNSIVKKIDNCILNTATIDSCIIASTVTSPIRNLEFKGRFSAETFSLDAYANNTNHIIVSKDSNDNTKIFNITDLVL